MMRLDQYIPVSVCTRLLYCLESANDPAMLDTLFPYLLCSFPKDVDILEQEILNESEEEIAWLLKRIHEEYYKIYKNRSAIVRTLYSVSEDLEKNLDRWYEHERVSIEPVKRKVKSVDVKTGKIHERVIVETEYVRPVLCLSMLQADGLRTVRIPFDDPTSCGEIEEILKDSYIEYDEWEFLLGHLLSVTKDLEDRVLAFLEKESRIKAALEPFETEMVSHVGTPSEATITSPTNEALIDAYDSCSRRQMDLAYELKKEINEAHIKILDGKVMANDILYIMTLNAAFRRDLAVKNQSVCSVIIFKIYQDYKAKLPVDWDKTVAGNLGMKSYMNRRNDHLAEKNQGLLEKIIGVIGKYVTSSAD